MRPFAVGDIVICIDPSSSVQHLTLDKIYKIKALENDELGNLTLHGVQFNWSPSRFRHYCAEVEISTAHPFKVGDVVRPKGLHYGKIDAVRDFFTDRSSSRISHQIRTTGNVWRDADLYELAEQNQPKPKNQTLEELVETANKGREALEELFILCPERMEYKTDKSDEWRTPKKYFNGLRYRLAPEVQFTSWTTKEGWTVSKDRAAITVGCKKFANWTILKRALSLIIESNNNTAPCSEGVVVLLDSPDMFATKQGVSFTGNVLNWEDAERLLKELKKFEEKK